jgi:hypothetical protein
VEGLWLEIPKFPKDAEVIDFAQNEDGVAALSRMIDYGLLVLVVERLKNVMDDGEDFTADKVGKFVAEIEELGEDDVDVTENEEEFAEFYSYVDSSIFKDSKNGKLYRIPRVLTSLSRKLYGSLGIKRDTKPRELLNMSSYYKRERLPENSSETND